MPSRAFRLIFFACVVAPILGLTACNEKTQLKEQIAEKQSVLSEKKAALAEIQKKSSALAPAGKSASTRQKELQELQNKIKAVEDESVALSARKASLEQLNREAQANVDAYTAKYLKP